VDYYQSHGYDRCHVVLRLGACMQDGVQATTRADVQTVQQQVTLDTGKDCRLAVAFWPIFTYDASSGSSLGVATRTTRNGRNLRLVEFEPANCSTTPLNWRTTKVLGLVPLPPPIQVCVETKELSVRGYSLSFHLAPSPGTAACLFTLHSTQKY
jgi:hypothetical protein